MNRRQFIHRSSAAAAGLALVGPGLRVRGAPGQASPNERVTVAVMGVRGRGRALLDTFASLPNVNLKYVCDLDPKVLAERTAKVVSETGQRPSAVKDFREVLDDKAVDALVLGTPDHWHAIPTIMACQAGKDVYVEKPDSHNLIEGRTMVAAAKKHGRIVQLGTQIRSSKHMASAMAYIREGHLGRALYAKAWESTKQSSIGRPADCDPPAGVDYDFWLGPAPKRPFNPRRWHGSWRWFFDYGTGDLGNDGVHRIDMARWALETAVVAGGGKPLGMPRGASATGGKYYFDDMQEWPDTLIVSWDYPGHVLTYEMRVWVPYRYQDEPEGAAVYGDQGYIVLGNGRWRAFAPDGKVVAQDQGRYDDATHITGFIDCMRSRKKPAADLETIGHPSSVLCHLGNASWRAGRSLKFDADTYTFIGDEEANQFRTRPVYRRPWTLVAIKDL